MFQVEINKIVDHLKASNDLFTYGAYKPRFNDTIGVDDAYAYYFFIADDVDDNADTEVWEETEETGCGSYEITGQFKLIAGFKSLDTKKALPLLIQQMHELFDIEVTSSSTDSEAIYKDEYPDSKGLIEQDILRIKFNLKIDIEFPICQEGLCLSDCL